MKTHLGDDAYKLALLHPRTQQLKVSIEPESPDQPEVIRLIHELEACQRPLYPAGSRPRVDAAALAGSTGLFVVAREKAGRAIGCCAIVFKVDYAEIKRMFVRVQYRGQGVGTALLSFVESHAIGSGFSELRLEANVLQPEALAICVRAGYTQRAASADCPLDPLRVFMQKSVH